MFKLTELFPDPNNVEVPNYSYGWPGGVLRRRANNAPDANEIEYRRRMQEAQRRAPEYYRTDAERLMADWTVRPTSETPRIDNSSGDWVTSTTTTTVADPGIILGRNIDWAADTIARNDLDTSPLVSLMAQASSVGGGSGTAGSSNYGMGIVTQTYVDGSRTSVIQEREFIDPDRMAPFGVRVQAETAHARLYHEDSIVPPNGEPEPFSWPSADTATVSGLVSMGDIFVQSFFGGSQIIWVVVEVDRTRDIGQLRRTNGEPTIWNVSPLSELLENSSMARIGNRTPDAFLRDNVWGRPVENAHFIWQEKVSKQLMDGYLYG